jgi:DNA-binding transcriptional ArsR family regulator
LSEVSTRRLLWWLLRATRGGPTRVRLLRLIAEKPMNANQLAKELGLDYTTVRHHLGILEKNKVVDVVGDKYGAVYCLSEWLTRKSEVLEQALTDGKGPGSHPG